MGFAVSRATITAWISFHAETRRRSGCITRPESMVQQASAPIEISPLIARTAPTVAVVI